MTSFRRLVMGVAETMAALSIFFGTFVGGIYGAASGGIFGIAFGQVASTGAVLGFIMGAILGFVLSSTVAGTSERAALTHRRADRTPQRRWIRSTQAP